MNTTIILIISMPMTLFAFFVLVTVYIGQKKARRDAHLNIIKGRSNEISIKKVSEEEEGAKRRADLAKKLKESEKKEAHTGGESYRDLITMAGLSMSVHIFFLLSGLSGALTGLAIFLIGQPYYIAMMMSVIGGLGIPRIILRIIARRRQKAFLKEFADVLENIVRMLKAGMPVIESIAMVVREFEGPVQEEMSRIYDEQKIGVPLYEAVQHSAKRMPLPEMQMFATSIAIQQQTGASLSEVLSNLARLIRARAGLKRKVKSLSAEAKASAAIIGSLPVFVAAILYVINPDYIMLLFTESLGNIWLLIGSLWMCMGIFVMRQMINFKV